MGRNIDFANTVMVNSTVLPHFRKTDSIMYLPVMKPLREKMRRLHIFDCEESFSAFTLAETLIVLTVLGVVAAITIPSLINRQQESANRTKLKKAMAVYEKALNTMIIEYDLKSDEAIAAEFPTTDATCSKTTEYFKKVERDNCRFKTADRVWWDITDIGHPVVMMNDKYKDTALTELRNLAKDKNNQDVFELVGGIKDGIVRINDKSAISEADKDYVDKLYAFINNEKGNGTSSNGDANASNPCDNPSSLACKIDIAKNSTDSCDSPDESQRISCMFYKPSNNNMLILYDEHGNRMFEGFGCTNRSLENCTSIRLFLHDERGNKIIQGENCGAKGASGDTSDCQGLYEAGYDGDLKLWDIDCWKSNPHCTYNVYGYDSNNRENVKKSGCEDKNGTNCTSINPQAYNDQGLQTLSTSGCNAQGEQCETKEMYEYDTDGNVVSFSYCYWDAGQNDYSCS